MAMYESDFTKFMNEFLEKNPTIEAQRREHRLTWWDKTLDDDEQASFRAARVPQKPYVYQTN